MSYADTEGDNKANLDAAARLLSVTLYESGERWVDVTTDYLVYFGTNRALVDDKQLLVGFSGERGYKLLLGRALVRVPQTPRFGCRGRLWVKLWNEFVGCNAKLMQTVLIANEDELGDELRTHFFPEWRETNHNLLFIHGFNNSFADAVSQAARLGVDLKVSGRTFCFSWPSAAKGLAWYDPDGAAIEASLPLLEAYIDIVLRQTGSGPLSIIVHSMGNRGVIRCLNAKIQDEGFRRCGRIRNIIFVAPDVDADVFRRSVPRLLPIAKKTTLYLTPQDLALKSARWIHNYGRSGLSPPVLTLSEMDTASRGFQSSRSCARVLPRSRVSVA